MAVPASWTSVVVALGVAQTGALLAAILGGESRTATPASSPGPSPQVASCAACLPCPEIGHSPVQFWLAVLLAFCAGAGVIALFVVCALLFPGVLGSVAGRAARPADSPERRIAPYRSVPGDSDLD